MRFKRFDPRISNTPELKAIPWHSIGVSAPKPIDSPADRLPEADIVIITWTDAEWASLQHVFISSGEDMSYSAQHHSHWTGWQKYDKRMPKYKEWQTWAYWGLYRLVDVRGRKVLLFKSNTHLDFPGEKYLESMTNNIIESVKPSLVFSIGTAGGCRLNDHVGTVNVVNATTLYDKNKEASKWITYESDWRPNWEIFERENFKDIAIPIPTVKEDIDMLLCRYNQYYETSYTLEDLNPNGVVMGDDLTKFNNLTLTRTSLLTTGTFVVGTTDRKFEKYACIEMDDAVIAKVCKEKDVSFGSIRNISNPVENSSLPFRDQKDWGSIIYTSYGFYTSYNGALAAYAIVYGELLK